MYLEAVFRFYVLLNHFVGHFFFGLVRFGSFSNTIYRNLALALSKLHINVDITVGFFVGQKNYRLHIVAADGQGAIDLGGMQPGLVGHRGQLIRGIQVGKLDGRLVKADQLGVILQLGAALQLPLVGNVPGQAGGRPEQLILEGKGAVAGEEIHLGQLGLRHEAQRQVGGIAVQVHIAEMVHLLEAGAAAVLMILVALIFRACGVLLCMVKTNLNAKERLFCVIAYLPKATVQAAIGSVPLAAGLGCGKIILSVAVMAIIITAPLGAFGMDMSYKKLL